MRNPTSGSVVTRRSPTFASLSYALRAATYALHHLARDSRVLAVWAAWCLDRGLTPKAMKGWRTAIASGADRTVLDTVIDESRDTMIADLAEFCRDGLGLAYPWLPSVLFDCFRLWVEDIVEGRLDAGHERRVLGWRLTEEWRAAVPPGRRRDTCERDVAWWYRVRVKYPPEAPENLSREVIPATTRDRTRARQRSSTPHKAIKHVEMALASLTLATIDVIH